MAVRTPGQLHAGGSRRHKANALSPRNACWAPAGLRFIPWWFRSRALNEKAVLSSYLMIGFDWLPPTPMTITKPRHEAVPLKVVAEVVAPLGGVWGGAAPCASNVPTCISIPVSSAVKSPLEQKAGEQSLEAPCSIDPTQ